MATIGEPSWYGRTASVQEDIRAALSRSFDQGYQDAQEKFEFGPWFDLDAEQKEREADARWEGLGLRDSNPCCCGCER